MCFVRQEVFLYSFLEAVSRPALLSWFCRSASSAAAFWKAQAGFCWWHLSLTATPWWEAFLSSKIIKAARALLPIVIVADQESGGRTQPLHIWSARWKPTISETGKCSPPPKKSNTHWFWELCSKRNSKYRSRQQRMMPILPPRFFSWSPPKNRQKQNHGTLSQMRNFSGDGENLARKFND